MIPQCINCRHCFADIDAIESTTFYWCDLHNHETFPKFDPCPQYEQSTHWTFEKDYPEVQLRKMFPELEEK